MAVSVCPLKGSVAKLLSGVGGGLRDSSIWEVASV